MPEKLIILVPAMDTVPTLFCQSLVGMQVPENAKYAFVCGSLVYDARNKLTAAAIQSEADYVLWLDSDMTFGPDFYIRMKESLDESEADMICAMFWGRKPPYDLVAYDVLEPDEETGGWFIRKIGTPPDGIMEIAACGCAGVLMKADLLADLVRLWNRPFEPVPGLGEDLTFCYRAGLLGKKLVCDGRIRMGHVGQAVYGEPISNGEDPDEK